MSSQCHRLTVWLSGGRLGGTREAEQLNYRAASSRAAQAARPLEPVLGGVLCLKRVLEEPCQDNSCDYREHKQPDDLVEGITGYQQFL